MEVVSDQNGIPDWSWNGGVVHGGANVLRGADPGFVNFAQSDFHLAETSVLRNATDSLINGVPPIAGQH